ncbi:MAG: response regulator transcription factor [Bacteroidetes bacterium]|nr:response regulator transcription factor [Bacteroidota bacterium]
MNPISIAIVDDEVDNISLINKSLHSYPSQFTIVGSFTDPREALSSFKENKPDLVLLDVEMPGMTGFDLLSQLDDESIEVVFITGHDQYAIKAIKCAAVDYILKPFDRAELHNAINKAKITLGNKRVRLNSIHRTPSPTQNVDDEVSKLIVPGTSAYLSITYENILYLRAIRGGYTMFYMTDGTKSLATNPLVFYDNLLGEHGFFRSHKSTLINLRHVLAYEPNMILTRLANGEELPLATRRKTEFMKEWKAMQDMITKLKTSD